MTRPTSPSVEDRSIKHQQNLTSSDGVDDERLRMNTETTALAARRAESDQMTQLRRDLHRHAEPGWCEVRTATLIAGGLKKLGYDTRIGDEVLVKDRMGLPSERELRAALARALEHGADPELAHRVAGGYTGVVGVIRGGQPGPTIGLRFDIDANYGIESTTGNNAAVAGYDSINPGVHHSCGHDAHVAIGMAVAKRLMDQRAGLKGEVRLIFQPAEEGLRGGPAMVAKGVTDGIDTVIGCHIGVQARETGTIIAGYRNILASTKFDVTFRGRNAHAGISPHEGRNAIQAAAIGVQNLLAIHRHGDGETRINVGTIEGGETRNSVPAHARVRAEVRADTTEIIGDLMQQVEQVVSGAGQVCGVETTITEVGGAEAASTSPELAQVIERVARRTEGVCTVRRDADFKGSDDMSSFMTAVQNAGGQAAYFGLGTHLTDFHHAPGFDIDDEALSIGVDLFVGILGELGSLT